MFDTIDKLTQAKTRLSLKEPFFQHDALALSPEGN